MSFPIPFEKWILDDLYNDIEQICMESQFSKEFFNQNAVASLFKNKNRNIWLFANLCKWYEGLFANFAN
jgi:hypothetical protein